MLSFAWDLNGDGLFTAADGAKRFGQLITLSWDELTAIGFTGGQSSRTSIGLQVDDKFGGVHVGSAAITINNAPPTARLILPTNVQENSPAIFKFADQSDVDGVSSLRYSLDWNGDNDFSDAGEFNKVSADQLAITFPDNADYTIKARIYDHPDSSQFTELVATIHVDNVAPSGTIFISAPSIAEGTQFQFGLTNVVDSTADLATLKYDFDLDGDGLFEVTNFSNSTHEVDLAASGDYALRVRVSDKDGLSFETQQIVRISNVAPNVQSFELNSSANIAPGQSVKFVGNFTDPGADDQDKWTGMAEVKRSGTLVSRVPLVLDATQTFQLDYTFVDSGQYTIDAFIDDGEATSSASATRSVNVSNPAPVIDAQTINAIAGRPLNHTFSFSDLGSDDWTWSADYGNGNSALITARTIARRSSMITFIRLLVPTR